MMNKDQKNNYINEMKKSFENNESVLVTHYQGLSMTQLDNLRSEMRKYGILFKITKNRITKLALAETKCKEIKDLFQGPTAVAFSEDGVSSAKVLAKFSKSNENLKILGGMMGSELLKAEDVKRISTLPSLDESKSKIIGILANPAQKIISILLAPGSKIAILAHEKSKQST